MSRMRSPVTSRSNCAKESSTFSVSRPMLVVVLNACVTDTKLTPQRSNVSTMRAKSPNEAGQPIHLVDYHHVDPSRLHVGQEMLQPRSRSMVPPEMPPSS